MNTETAFNNFIKANPKWNYHPEMENADERHPDEPDDDGDTDLDADEEE